MNTHELLMICGLETASGLPYPGLRLVFGQVLLAGTVAALHQHGRVAVDETSLTVLHTERVGCPAMDAVLASLRGASAGPQDLGGVGRALVGRVEITRLCGEALAGRGVVIVHHKRLLWIFAKTVLEVRRPEVIRQARAEVWQRGGLTTMTDAVRAARIIAEQESIRGGFEEPRSVEGSDSVVLSDEPAWLQGVALMVRSGVRKTGTGTSPQS